MNKKLSSVLFCWTLFFFAGIFAIYFYDLLIDDLRTKPEQFFFCAAFCSLPILLRLLIPKHFHAICLYMNTGPFFILFGLLFSIGSTWFFVDTLPKRFIFFVLFTPFFVHCVRGIYLKLIKQKNYEIKLVGIFLIISLGMLWIPGGYAPPFYNGIAGWTVKIPGEVKAKERSLTGIQLTRNDGQTRWLSYGVLSPINFVQRHWFGFSKKHYDQRADLYKFYFMVYCYNYDLLRKGKFPNQRFLGSFGYPGHTPYVVQDYVGFEPNDISTIGWVTERRSVATMQKLDRTVLEEYEITPLLKDVNCATPSR